MQVQTPEALLKKLVAVRSDTGTAMECAMARAILDILEDAPYFRAHPDYCGAWDGGDKLGRPVVWALKKGTGTKTVILNGHYDAVEIENYGVLKPWALDPDTLLEKMLESPLVEDAVKAQLATGKWMVGRGAADMKSGIAINLYLMLSAELPAELNILFTAVSDEENLSAGARQAAGLYMELKKRFGLDYKLAVVTEPDSFKQADEPFNIMHGTCGKMLPMVVAKGRVAHGANMLNGLNPSLIIAEVVRQVELSTAFQSPSHGIAPHPPTTQFLRDSKETYDVSLPEYCAAGFNLMTLYPASPAKQAETLLDICRAAADAAVAKYSATWDAVAGTGVQTAPKADYRPDVLTVEALKARLRDTLPDFDLKLRRIDEAVTALLEKGHTMQSAGMTYIRLLMELTETSQPLVVLGFVPPYYPSVTNYALSPETVALIDGVIARIRAENIADARPGAFIPGPTDLSYFACQDLAANRRMMESLCVPAATYSIDFEALAELQIPSVQVGATGPNVHELTERVYLPELNEQVPQIVLAILDALC